MAMKSCKECKTEISSKAKKCPHCGVDTRNWFMRHKILTFIGAVIILGAIGAASGGEGDKTTTASVSSGSSASKSSNEVIAKVGDAIKTDKFEITITSIEEKSRVGTEFINSKPSQGGTYIVVNWQYKNISDKPIGTFSQPSVKLLDKNKTKYDNDVSASSSYATEVKLDNKIISDLNPGITVKDADVFEVSKELYQQGGWRLLVDADKDSYININ